MGQRQKPSRKDTQERLEAVADATVGEHALDAAFAAFDETIANDPERLAAIQARIRALLAEGIRPAPGARGPDDDA
jgi:hypothetical protein